MLNSNCCKSRSNELFHPLFPNLGKSSTGFRGGEVSVPFLQGSDRSLPRATRGNPFGRRYSSSDRRDVRHVVLDGVLADVGIVVSAELSGRRVVDQLDLSVLNRINQIRTAFVRFENRFGFDQGAVVERGSIDKGSLPALHSGEEGEWEDLATQADG